MVRMYISVLIIIFFTTLADSVSSIKKKVLFFALVLLFVFLALRLNVGTDYLQYTALAKKMISGQSFGIEPSFEIATRFFGDVFLVFAVYAFLSMAFIGLYLKQLEFSGACLSFYVAFYFLQWNTSTIRQGLAIAISCFGLSCYKSRPGLFFLMVALASTVHISSLTLFLIPIFDYCSKRITLFWLPCGLLAIFVNVFVVDIVPVLSELKWLPYRHYLEYKFFIVDKTFGFGSIARTIIPLMAISSIRFFGSKFAHSKAVLNVAFLTIFLNLSLAPLGVASRVLKPFEVFLLLSLLNFAYCLLPRRIVLPVLCMSSSFFIVLFVYKLHTGVNYFPYESYLTKVDSSFQTVLYSKKVRMQHRFKQAGVSEKHIQEDFSFQRVFSVESK